MCAHACAAVIDGDPIGAAWVGAPRVLTAWTWRWGCELGQTTAFCTFHFFGGLNAVWSLGDCGFHFWSENQLGVGMVCFVFTTSRWNVFFSWLGMMDYEVICAV